MQTPQEMAAALLGTQTLPAGAARVQALAGEAWAYHTLTPYPAYHFQDWQTEDRGPLPRCLPLAKGIVKRGARFLFGKPLRLTCAGNDRWEAFVQQAWAGNAMGARLVPMAVRGALESGVVLKFSYDDANTGCPLSIQSLSIVDQVRLYFNPHDRDQLLMARVQYPYQNPADGKTYYYREEWTAEEEVHYEPLAAGDLNGSIRRLNPDSAQAWTERSRTPNKFGAIPLVYIKNQETDDLFGALDLEDLYRVLDNIHLTYHLMNKSNQFDSEINPIFIDAELDARDIDHPLQPGQPLDLKSESPDDGHQARVVFPSGSNALRPAMMDYAKDLRKQVLAAASSVEIDQTEFSNKGNLTIAVLEQLFQPLIEITEEKRKSWGDDGLCVFWATVAKALVHAGVADLGIDASDPDTYAVTIQWPPHFSLSEAEKTAKTGRLQEQELAGYLPHDRAIEEVSAMEGRADVQPIKDELAAEPRPSPTENDTRLPSGEAGSAK